MSTAQYQQVADKLDSRLTDLSVKTEQVRPKARAAADHWYVTDALAEAVVWTADKLYEIGKWIVEKITELAEGITAPVMFIVKAFDWQDVHRKASEVAGEIQPKGLPAPRKWKGEGADAYTSAVWQQPTAASQIGNIADEVTAALAASAVSGGLFYLALAAVVAKLVVAMSAAIVAYGSVAFSWVGLAITLEEFATNTGLIWGAVTALSVALGTQTERLFSLTSEAQDHKAFPRGHWPDPSA